MTGRPSSSVYGITCSDRCARFQSRIGSRLSRILRPGPGDFRSHAFVKFAERPFARSCPSELKNFGFQLIALKVEPIDDITFLPQFTKLVCHFVIEPVLFRSGKLWK
jgi:hypothetical protein